jgi:hypothetical protein
LFELFVSSPRFEDTWQFGAIFGEYLNLLSHDKDFFLDLSPLNIFPSGKSILDLGVEIVKFIEKFDLFLGLFKLWILLVWKTKKLFSTIVRVELSLSNKIFFLEHFKSVKSNLWFNTWNTWTILNEVSSEVGNIIDEEVNLLDQIFLELRLLGEETILNFRSLFDKTCPIFI